MQVERKNEEEDEWYIGKRTICTRIVSRETDETERRRADARRS